MCMHFNSRESLFKHRNTTCVILGLMLGLLVDSPASASCVWELQACATTADCRPFSLLLALNLASPPLWGVSISIFSYTSGVLPRPPDGFYPSLETVVLGWGVAQRYWASLVCLWRP